MEIVDFLLQRIAEDEALARRVADGPGEPGGRGIWSVAIGVSGNDAKFAHVASDPARVLAECAAKRAIIEQRRRSDRSASQDMWEMGYSDANYDALNALAAVYKDHADYREDWATK